VESGVKKMNNGFMLGYLCGCCATINLRRPTMPRLVSLAYDP
jgi:hypothetical protein